MAQGIKVSRKGFDVKTASDKQLAFSSEWPLLPIEAEGTFDVTAGNSYDELLYEHNLGYPPVFMYWVDDGTKKYPIGPVTITNIYSDSTNLWIDENVALFTGTIHWKVFRRSLLTNFESEILNSTDATEQDSSEYGIKVSLPGKDVGSTDKRDFGVRSDVRQLMIHMSGVTTASTGGAVTHNLGYKPIYWFFVENTTFNPSGSWSLRNQADDFSIEATDTQLTWIFYGFPPYKWSYLIFKDPADSNG